MEIWFNPSCSKCQAARTAIDVCGEPYTLRNYLEVPPSEVELDELFTKLARQPWEVCRMKEPIADELGLPSMAKDRATWIRVMVEHPILIERPILVCSDGRAVIGRSDEALADALRRARE